MMGYWASRMEVVKNQLCEVFSQSRRAVSMAFDLAVAARLSSAKILADDAGHWHRSQRTVLATNTVPAK